MKNYLTISLVILGIYSCSSTQRLSVDEYLSWYSSDKNPVSWIDSTSNDFMVSIRQTTKEYDAAKCFKSKCLPTDTLKSILKKQEESLVYQLRYKLPYGDMFSYNSSSEIPKQDRMQYYGFDLKKDIHLITVANDTINCTSLIFERGIPSRPIGYFEFSFPYVAWPMIKKIEINNRALSRKATTFEFELQNTELPQLKLK